LFWSSPLYLSVKPGTTFVTDVSVLNEPDSVNWNLSNEKPDEWAYFTLAEPFNLPSSLGGHVSKCHPG